MKTKADTHSGNIIKQSEEETDANREFSPETTDVNSIQEFIELKKLQNRILGKMLEKINLPENQTKTNNK